MKIGLDFDQTIVNYDEIFHEVATQWRAIPPELSPSKLAIRDFLRKEGKEEVWTHLQGYVYGCCIQNAAVYSGLLAFLQKANAAGHTLMIVSHKTKQPFLGPPYDLHQAAHQWIKQHLHLKGVPLLSHEHIFFETTKEKKLERIETLGCDLFIDDLPEILLSPDFPKETSTILFDPEERHPTYSGCAFSSWEKIQHALDL